MLGALALILGVESSVISPAFVLTSVCSQLEVGMGVLRPTHSTTVSPDPSSSMNNDVFSWEEEVSILEGEGLGDDAAEYHGE